MDRMDVTRQVSFFGVHAVHKVHAVHHFEKGLQYFKHHLRGPSTAPPRFPGQVRKGLDFGLHLCDNASRL
jgi:hypothetical protein